jgi:hypothetical protein
MKFFTKRFKKITLLSTAGYIFIFAFAAKLVFIYGSQHPAKYDLLPVNGIVKEVRLGGHGNSTSFRIQSDRGNHRYSSYYGKVWPGMERVQIGDWVQILAERKKLNRDEIISGKEYYIWELIHNNQVILTYHAVWALVTPKEATTNRYARNILAVSIIFLAIAYARTKFHVK